MNKLKFQRKLTDNPLFYLNNKYGISVEFNERRNTNFSQDTQK